MISVSRFLSALVAAATLATAPNVHAGSHTLGPGDSVADFALPDVTGATHWLSQYSDSTAVVVMFIATQCPVSNDYNTRMTRLATEYQPRGFQFLGINSNKQESTEECAMHAEQNSLTFPVLKDDRNVIADRFGATRTPEVYVIAQNGTILYHGRIDDSRNIDRVESRDLEATLDAIFAGTQVPVTETRAFGCSIKRVTMTK